jgi:hypothetical protein
VFIFVAPYRYSKDSPKKGLMARVILRHRPVAAFSSFLPLTVSGLNFAFRLLSLTPYSEETKPRSSRRCVAGLLDFERVF